MTLQTETKHDLDPPGRDAEGSPARRSRRFWYTLLGVGVLALAAGGGTFASFSAETDNPNNTFATGSLLLSNQVQSGTVCFSYNGASNVNHGCDVVINSTAHKPGESATSLGALGRALTSGTSYTSLSVAALPVALPQGAVLVLHEGSNSEQVTTRAAAALNATSISTVAFTASASFSTSATVTLSPFVTATVTIGDVGTIDGSTLKLFPGATSLGSLATGLTNGSNYTSISVAALASAVPAGATLVLNPGGSPTQQLTVASTAAQGATTVSVSSFTANSSYSTSTQVLQSGCTSSTVNSYTFNTGNLCNDTDLFVQELGQGTVTNAGAFTQTTNNTYCWYGAQAAAPPYPSPAASTCDANSSVSGQTINGFEVGGGVELLPLSGSGATTTGTELQSLHARQFVVGLYLPSAVGNPDQSLQALFPLVWTISQ